MNNIIEETILLVKKFQEQCPGKRISLNEGRIDLVDSTPEEEELYQNTLKDINMA
jgi:hypothetical protein